MNTTALAYIGDGIYEVYIRQHVLGESPANVDILHRKATGFVRADSQALVMKRLMKEKESSEAPCPGAFRLTDEEEALVKRARNRKITSMPKNTLPVTYKWATAFEALTGFLYLAGMTERMEELINRAIEIIEGERSMANE